MGLEQLPGNFPIAFTAGDDVVVTFTVADGVTPYSWSGVTVDAQIVGHPTVTTWGVDTSTDGILILSLSDVQTTALGAFSGGWFLRITAGTDTRTWSAGKVRVTPPRTPGRGSTTAMSGTIAIELTNTVGRGVPAGGVTGQVLSKVSSGDYDTDWITAAGLGDMLKSENLSGLADVATARTNIGAETAGAAAAAQAASQPLDSDLTAIAALSTTAYGRAFLALADAAAGRTALGLGTAATTAASAYATAAQGATADTAVQPATLTAHTGATTTVHGIADTSKLVSSPTLLSLVEISQAAYDLLTPVATTIYYITS